MIHEAIYKLYPSVVSINGDGDDTVARDVNGDVVSLDASAVSTKQAELVADFKLNELRAERNRLLSETDYWDLSDTVSMTDVQKAYRQDLRDITKTATSLNDVSWPEKP